jgi:hypothetical protein
MFLLVSVPWAISLGLHSGEAALGDEFRFGSQPMGIVTAMLGTFV